jgi:hypothetical protein
MIDELQHNRNAPKQATLYAAVLGKLVPSGGSSYYCLLKMAR